MAQQAQGIQPEADISPPWGAFPAEQYLIRHWDYSSPFAAHDQRRHLIQKYLKLDSIPKEWDATGRIYLSTTISRVPTEYEVQEILQSWRPLRWREAALQLWRHRGDEEVWLRTYYGEESDEKFRTFREIDEDEDPAFEEPCRTWSILDDQDLFEGDWSAALHVLPELAGPIPNYDAYNHRHFGVPEKLELLRKTLRDSIASALSLAGEGNTAEQLKIDEVEAGLAGLELQAHIVGSFLLIADAEAFETDKLRLLFLDTQGNIVRETRIPCEETWQMRDYWNAKKFRDSPFWLDRDRSEWSFRNYPGSVLGAKYKFSGDIGRILHGLD